MISAVVQYYGIYGAPGMEIPKFCTKPLWYYCTGLHNVYWKLQYLSIEAMKKLLFATKQMWC